MSKTQKIEFNTNTLLLIHDLRLKRWAYNCINETKENKERLLKSKLSISELIRKIDLSAYLERLDDYEFKASLWHEYLNQGLLLRQENNIGAAIGELRRAVNANPKSALSWFYLAVSYDNQGKESRAIPSYIKALDLELNDITIKHKALLFLCSSLSKRRHACDMRCFLERIKVADLKDPFLSKLYDKLVKKLESNTR